MVQSYGVLRWFLTEKDMYALLKKTKDETKVNLFLELKSLPTSKKLLGFIKISLFYILSISAFSALSYSNIRTSSGDFSSYFNLLLGLTISAPIFQMILSKEYKDYIYYKFFSESERISRTVKVFTVMILFILMITSIIIFVYTDTLMLVSSNDTLPFLWPFVLRLPFYLYPLALLAWIVRAHICQLNIYGGSMNFIYCAFIAITVNLSVYMRNTDFTINEGLNEYMANRLMIECGILLGAGIILSICYITRVYFSAK